MKSSGNARASLMAAMAIAMMGAVNAAPLSSAGSGNNRRPTPPRRDTALQREIAEHNDAVERRKAAKRARKMGRSINQLDP